MFSMGISARIVKRIITLLIVTLGVVTLSFCLQIFTGTDPAEMLVRKTTLFATEEQIQAMRVELGLDGTLSEQYKRTTYRGLGYFNYQSKACH